jgi:flagellar motility protein MotE (MotC chaperone)
MNAKAELNIKQVEFDNIQKAYDAASDAVSTYKDNHDKVKNDTRYLNLKVQEDKLERDKDRLEEDVEHLEEDMKAFEKLLKSENKTATDIEL